MNPYANRLPLLAGLLLLLAACAPRVNSADTALNSPAAQATEQVAQIAYHRMEIGRLQTGEYTTNALLELALPKGVKWTLQEFASDNYRLNFTSDDLPGYAWVVTPVGVRLHKVE